MVKLREGGRESDKKWRERERLVWVMGNNKRATRSVMGNDEWATRSMMGNDERVTRSVRSNDGADEISFGWISLG